MKQDMNIVIVGHVDHGKSTLIGRLLADTYSLPEGKLEQVRETCRRNSKPFEYAFLLDALKDEQSQGITIDTARCFFKTEKRNYLILDAPGHIEFLKNMITGAARAEAAILVIDANEGVRENSRRHGYMLKLLGVKEIVIAINKMDLADYSEAVFNELKTEYDGFLSKLDISPMSYIPISASKGDNIASKSAKMPWYRDMTVLEALDAFACQGPPTERVFRMPVQDVYKFTRNGDNRRIVAGTIESGSINKGSKVILYPSGKSSAIKAIESFPPRQIDTAFAGQAAGFTLTEQIYINRGEIMVIDGQEPPCVCERIRSNVFWLGKRPMQKGKRYILKIGTKKTAVILEEIISVMNSSDLTVSFANSIACNEVAECILKTEKPIAFDPVHKLAATGRFVLVDDYEITGGGIILSEVKGELSEIREKVMLRDYKWEHSEISSERRAERYNQKPLLLIFTGENNVGKKRLAKAVELSLVESGRFAYYLGIGTFLYGVDSDIKSKHDEALTRKEHIRRFAEVANIMLDAGLILIVTARALTASDHKLMRTIISADIRTVWVGGKITTDLKADMITAYESAVHDDRITMIRELLKNEGYVFKG